MTRKQTKREQLAELCDVIADGKSEQAKQLRATNRRVEKRKRAQFRRRP